MRSLGRAGRWSWLVTPLLLFLTVAAAAQPQRRPPPQPQPQPDPVRAVRELGREERPAAIKEILPLLSHTRPDVRREAANAVGQALAAVPRIDGEQPPELAIATRALLGRLSAETDAAARSVVAETLGRLPNRDPATLREIELALRVRLQDVHPAAAAGAAKGLDTLIRGTAKIQPPEPATLAQLRLVATTTADPADADLALVRRMSWLALTAAGPLDAVTIERGYEDPDLQVRRRIVIASNTAEMSPAQRRALLVRALSDPAFQVRGEAARGFGRLLAASAGAAAGAGAAEMERQDCDHVLRAVDDTSLHVSLAAIDALGSGCRSAVPRLLELTETVDPVRWHRSAQAFLSLARLAREEATPRLARFAEAADWQVRMYAARAAAVLGAAARLERLAADTHDNVRHAALEGLRQVQGHAADAIFIEALGRSDYQLVMYAAQALEGSPDAAGAVPALLNAYARLTAENRDTSRDPRVAILVRLQELGSRANVAALGPCFADKDFVVATACAATLRAWTGVAPPVDPPALRPRAAIPEQLPTRARITMATGGAMEVRLFGDDAPETVARFATLAREGYYDGLSFWRVSPGQWIQGGSPGSNEYAGADPFMRDELGLRSHTRGTLGISTRGRHTGDAQIFVNLLDNPRLDHEFTAFAEITSGMDVADNIVEGDVIKSIEILE